MALLTEEIVRQMSNRGTRGPVVVRAEDVLSPSARSYLKEHRVEIVYPQGKPQQESGQAGGEGKAPSTPAPRRYETLFGATLTEKPEHMTHLHGNVLVFKSHPRIAFRGQIDLLEAEITLCQQAVMTQGYRKLCAELEEVLAFVRNFIRMDVLGEPLGTLKLCGYTAEQLREYSHYPERHFGQPHFMVFWQDGPAILALNRLRTQVRCCELAAYAAFRDENGAVLRDDVILGLNRLSSLLWIMMIKCKAGKYEREGVGAHGTGQ